MVKDVVRYEAEDGMIFRQRDDAVAHDRMCHLRDALLKAVGYPPAKLSGRTHSTDDAEKWASMIEKKDPSAAERITAALA